MTNQVDISGYRYEDSKRSCAHGYLLPTLLGELDALPLPENNKRLFDLGCGNGVVGNELAQQGFQVTGVDPSTEGIEYAKTHYPDLNLHAGSTLDPLAETYGTYPLVVSLEVVEHVYDPYGYAACIADLLEPGGYAMISTPYHGYLKNLVLAVTGKMDSHYTALWPHGHIKFWSIKTLTTLLTRSGLEVVRVRRVGRLPLLAKSMVLIARKPADVTL